jgi:hypothetical protein
MGNRPSRGMVGVLHFLSQSIHDLSISFISLFVAAPLTLPEGVIFLDGFRSKLIRWHENEVNGCI